MDAVQGALLALEAASAALYLTMVSGFLVAMRRRTPARAPPNTPRVSILKPLAGVDDELDENLSSFATLDYPDYEIVLGVASAEDSAYPVARKFVETVGAERARLVVTDPEAAANPKVAQLVALERAATGEVVVVCDSNVRVTPGYLDLLLAELSSPGVGTVSNIVAGTGERTLGAAMENLQLGAIIAPGIVASAFVCPPFDSNRIAVATFWWRRAFFNASGASRSRRAAFASFFPAMSVVTGPSRSFPSCSNRAARKYGSSRGAVPSPMSGSLCAPL